MEKPENYQSKTVKLWGVAQVILLCCDYRFVSHAWSDL
mgnify:CR=1 FL=1